MNKFIGFFTCINCALLVWVVLKPTPKVTPSPLELPNQSLQTSPTKVYPQKIDAELQKIREQLQQLQSLVEKNQINAVNIATTGIKQNHQATTDFSYDAQSIHWIETQSYVDQVIANGSLYTEEINQLRNRLKELSPEEANKLRKRLFQAINADRLETDPQTILNLF